MIRDKPAVKGSVPGGAAQEPTDPASWVDRYGDLLYRFALARVADPAEAEELVQETFLAALQGLENFRHASRVSSWLVGILKHKIIDHFRRRARDAELPSGDDDWETKQVQADQYRWRSDPQQALEDRQLRQVFLSCLDELSPTLKSVIVLRHMDGLDAQQVCKELGLNPTNLWVRLYRARALLRACLEERWFKQGRSRSLGRPRRRPGASGRRPSSPNNRNRE